MGNIINHTELSISELLDLKETIASTFFEDLTYPWEVIPLIKDKIGTLGAGLSSLEYVQHQSNIWISKSASVAPNATIQGPAIIGHHAEIRHCAYIRGNVIVGEGAVVGNSTELKNAILFNNVQVPHFTYVGDSVLGYKAHIGAGGITSNVKSDKSLISVTIEGQRIPTNLRKFGAILGDYVEVGSNSVLNPGTIIGRRSNIYPLSMVRGFVPANCIYKKQGDRVLKQPE